MIASFLQRRRLRRDARRWAHEAKHVLNMREDILAPDLARRIRAGLADVREARRSGDRRRLDAAREPLHKAIREACPPRPYAGFRENLEMLVVAVSVAMAVRCFFIQPFKIPTGSMQPTLYGVTVQPQRGRAWHDRIPFSIPGWVLFGEGYTEVRARRAGAIHPEYARTGDGFVIFIDGVPHRIRRDMPTYFELGDRVERGTLLASGRVRMGDHVFVNKMAYNFARPARGNIIVFETDRIDFPGMQDNEFYIKRACGLPQETVGIVPPHILVDGLPVREPPVFRRLVEDTAAGYVGHEPAGGGSPRPPVLGSPEDRVVLGAHEFLMFGDNTRSSLDSRYFGAVRRESLVGPAFMVYWPFSRRWGAIH